MADANLEHLHFQRHKIFFVKLQCLILELIFISYFVFRRQPAELFFSKIIIKKSRLVRSTQPIHKLVAFRYFDSFTLLFWFDLFLQARAEFLKEFSLILWEKRCRHKIILVFIDLYSGEFIFGGCLVIWNHCAAEAVLIRRDLLGNFTEEPVRPLWPSLVQAASTAYDYILPLSAVPTAKSTAADITASACRREERLRHTVSLD